MHKFLKKFIILFQFVQKYDKIHIGSLRTEHNRIRWMAGCGVNYDFTNDRGVSYEQQVF